MSRTFEDLLQSDPELRRRYELISKVGGESERGMTVLVAAELDRVLEVVVKSYLVPGKARDDLFSGGSPPLGTFSARINIARALYLIREDEYELLHLIRRIRNEFAHNPDAAFTDRRISSWLSAIPERESKTDTKSKFTLCSVELIAALEADAVHQANGRVYEESFNTYYRRGRDPDVPPFNSADDAAAAYKAGKS
jgi:DNA-binding MltR family transcriptional regulator